MRTSAEIGGGAASHPHPALNDDEVRVALALRLNLLLMGRDVDIEAALAGLLPRMASPVALWEARGSPDLVLPSLRTVVVRNVGKLSTAEQQQLNEHLDSWRGSVQIVSTTSRSFLSRVERGGFSERLYYRLNIVCVDLRPVSLATPR